MQHVVPGRRSSRKHLECLLGAVLMREVIPRVFYAPVVWLVLPEAEENRFNSS